MSAVPDIASIAALVGHRARARILTHLMAGRAFTATELSRAAGVTKQTTSSHLSRLLGSRLVVVESQVRQRYFRLAHPDVGAALESLMGVAQRVGVQMDASHPDPALRKARVCYDHLAGELGVLVFDSLTQRGLLRTSDRGLSLTEPGERFVEQLGIDLATLQGQRRPLCLPCLDWSAGRHHLAGALGAALLGRCFALGWAKRHRGARVVHFSALGERALRARFSVRDMSDVRAHRIPLPSGGP